METCPPPPPPPEPQATARAAAIRRGIPRRKYLIVNGRKGCRGEGPLSTPCGGGKAPLAWAREILPRRRPARVAPRRAGPGGRHPGPEEEPEGGPPRPLLPGGGGAGDRRLRGRLARSLP